MHRSVELELEEVDRIHDEQLLRKANVSPFFTSARALFTMPHELDFSPRAIPRVTEELTASATSVDLHSTITPRSLDAPSLSSSSLSGADGELDAALSRVSSHQDFSASLSCSTLSECYPRDELPLYSDDCSSIDHSTARDSVYTKGERHKREDAVEYEPDLQTGERKALTSDERSNDRKPDCLDVRKPLCLVGLETFEPATDRSRDSVSSFERKTRSVLSTGASSVRAGRSAKSRVESWESRVRRTALNAQLAQPHKSLRDMRETMFPHCHHHHHHHQQQQSVACKFDTNQVRVKKPIAANNNLFEMIPFPAESLGAAGTAPSRVACNRYIEGNDNQCQQQAGHSRTWKKHSPLPDAIRTTKSQRRSANRFIHEWSTPVSTQKKPMHSTIGSSLLTPVAPFGSDQQQHCCIVVTTRLQPRQHATQLTGATAFALPLDRQTQCSSSEPTSYCNGHAVLPTPLRVDAAPLSQQTQQEQSRPLKRMIGAYSPTSRRARIRRYHEKRKQLVFYKRVKYAGRKRLAIACPRIKGRFVCKQDLLDEQARAD